MGYARIMGTGSYLPQRIVTNQELETRINTSDEWIDLEQLRQGEAVYLNLMRSQIRLED